MEMKGNTILITGGGSGIGLGLAQAFAKSGNQVVISGRGNKKPGDSQTFPFYKVDMSRLESIEQLAKQVTAEHPKLNAVIHSAGMMVSEDLLSGENYDKDENATISTNLLGPIRLTEALLPHLRAQPNAVVMTVSSGLAFVPLAMTPTYCATKAAIHSYTQSLRYQLKDTAVQVIELIPPYVATTLTGDRQASDPRAMPLDEYISESMQILKDDPDVQEISVKRVHPLRFAAEEGQEKYEQFFRSFNDQMSQERR